MKNDLTYAEVILRAYPHLEKIAGEIREGLIKFACKTFAMKGGALKQAEELIDKIYEMRRLENLKWICDKVLERMSAEEIELFKYKYFGNRAIDGFDYTSRSYFRKQNRALKHFHQLLGYVGLDEKRFYSDYGDVHVIKSTKAKIKEKCYHARCEKTAKEKLKKAA